MNRAVKVAVPVPVIVFVLAMAAGARAADTKAVRAEVASHEKAFVAAYEGGETKKMKAEIGKAVSLGEKNGLGADPLMADVYVLAAVLEVDGNENTKAGVRDFVKALKLKPDAAIPKGMGTSPVKAAFKQARVELGLEPKEGAVATTAGAAKAEAAKPETAKPETAKAPAEKTDKVAQKAADEAAAKEQQNQQNKDKQAREDQAKAQKDLALAKETEGKERGEQERLRKEKADLERASADRDRDKDKQLADAKARIQQLEKDRADKDRDKDKQLADARSRVQQLEKDKAERDRQLADAKARIQQLEKDRAEKDKQLADATAREGKAREELDRVARAKQAAETQARDAENKKKQERQERERLFAGPEMPGHLREALTCAVPDEAPLRTDLFVHCVARPNVKSRSLVFYYRSGSSRYTSVPMERTAKGWYAAIVPGMRVTGKVLQYYAEALDGREAVVASNGKEASPNILILRPVGPRG